MRAIEPIRIAGLVETVPILLVHGGADPTIPLADARRLVAAIGSRAEHWIVPDAGHSTAHATDPIGYDERVGGFLRGVFADTRSDQPIIAPPAFDETSADASNRGVQEGD
jgi:fermentation-respiration switch protein FrsA (DUF1100 family)